MFMFYFTPSLVHWANPAHLQDKRLYDRERCGCGDDDDDDNAIVSIVRWVVLSKGDDCWMEVFSFIPRHLKRFSIENLWYLYIAHAARAPKRCSITQAQLPGVADSAWTHRPTFDFQLNNIRHEGWFDPWVCVSSIWMKNADICPREVGVTWAPKTCDYVARYSPQKRYSCAQSTLAFKILYLILY